MGKNPIFEDRRGYHETKLIAKAICTWADGKTKGLYATRFNLGGAFILCLTPPAIGTRLSTMFYPLKQPALPPMEARVIGIRIDPANAEMSGFEVMFQNLDDNHIKQLTSTVNELERTLGNSAFKVGIGTTPTITPFPEKREKPRVPIDLTTIVNLPYGSFEAQVINMSLSGALLGLQQPVPEELILDSEITINVFYKNKTLKLKAKVVRITQEPEPFGFGLSFSELDYEDEKILEQIILNSIVGDQVSLFDCS